MSSNIVGTEVAQFMGYSNLKPEQEQLINGILSKCNVLGFYQLDLSLNSLCYSRLPLHKYMTGYMKKNTIVTRLLAITKHQVWCDCYIFILKLYFTFGEPPDLIHTPIRDTEKLHHLHASRILLHCHVITCKLLLIAFQKHDLCKLGSPDP